MPHVSSTGPTLLDERLSLRPIGIDDFSPNRALLVERMEVTGG